MTTRFWILLYNFSYKLTMILTLTPRPNWMNWTRTEHQFKVNRYCLQSMIKYTIDFDNIEHAFGNMDLSSNWLMIDIAYLSQDNISCNYNEILSIHEKSNIFIYLIVFSFDCDILKISQNILKETTNTRKPKKKKKGEILDYHLPLPNAKWIEVYKLKSIRYTFSWWK